MEGNVSWIQQFAESAAYVLNLLKCLKKTPTESAGGSSPAAPASDAALTLISSPTTVLEIVRTSATQDGLFGKAIIGNKQVCVTMERKDVAIPAGIYPGRKRFSPHLNRLVVGIDVPGRTDIEGHNANYLSQLQGCIAFGSTVDNDSLDNSVKALEKVLSLLPDTFTVSVSEQYVQSA